ncbi:MAG: hypothetical protein WC412_08025 [Candidatus Omnitrophota bacterium]|jgi:hypothetical protein
MILGLKKKVRILFNFGLLFSILALFPLIGFSRGPIRSDKYNERTKGYIDSLEKENPKLAAFEKKLYEINLKIHAIAEDYHEGRLPYQKAKEKLIPLLKEQQQIMHDPEYLAELALSSGFVRR